MDFSLPIAMIPFLKLEVKTYWVCLLCSMRLLLPVFDDVNTDSPRYHRAFCIVGFVVRTNSDDAGGFLEIVPQDAEYPLGAE